MKNKVFWIPISILILLSTIFVSCAETTTSTTSPTIQTTSTSPPQTTSSSLPLSSTTVTTTSPPPTTTPTETNWWDSKFGTPQYGGTITIAGSSIENSFDSYSPMNTNNNYYDEPLWIIDPTLDRTKADLTSDWISYQYWKGNVAQSWSWSDPEHLVVNLRQDVYWQNKAPVNGRQFTADDVVFHFDRLLGTGSGFTTPDPILAGSYGTLQKVTAQDKFTVVFTFGTPATFANSEAIINDPRIQFFESPEVYAMGSSAAPTTSATSSQGNGGPPEAGGFNSALNDWHNAVGTGPFVLSNFVSGSIINYTKSSNYWAYDERYPQNRLPYADGLNVIYMGDPATEKAALRTGKIDLMDQLGWKDADQLKQTNPDLLNGPEPQPGFVLQLRVDEKPFSDINVRKALQLAVDLPTIANSWGGKVSWKPVGIANPETGFAVPYDQWPAELQQEYTYNPTKAKQLLTDAGYSNGLTITCDESSSNFPWPGGSEGSEFLQILQSYFNDIGVNLNIEQYDFPTLVSMLATHKQDQAVLMGTPTTMAPLTAISLYLSTCSSNAIMQNDPKFDQMINACNSADSISDAQKLVSEVDMYLLQQHWITTTFPLCNYIFWQPYFKGYDGEKVFLNNVSPYYARDWIDKNLEQSEGQ